MEYRGYDSAGIAYLTNGKIEVTKRAGKLTELGKALDETPKSANIAIAHSRWATHGGPTDANAHPHYDQFERIALIHNGIIENYLELKHELAARGHKFQSQTDTEVAAHIVGEEYQDGVSLENAVRKAVKKLRGAYSLVIISQSEPGKIVCVRNASPLVLGLGNGENMLASDIPALLPYTREVIVMEENSLAVLTKDTLDLYDAEGRVLPVEPMHIDWDISSAERGGYDHFMLKEINEQPTVMRQAIAGRIDEKGAVRSGFQKTTF